MMPTGPRILELVREGVLVLDPMPTPEDVNPNSVNLRLGDRLKVYRAQLEYYLWLERETSEHGTYTHAQLMHGAAAGFWSVPDAYVLEPYGTNPTIDLSIPPAGLVLMPGLLYLGHTIERAGSTCRYAPVLEGRSTWARLGLQVHLTAGVGDVGYGSVAGKGQWTLEITVMTPVRVRPGDPICQIMFHETEGPEQLYAGRYAHQSGPTAAVPLPGRT